MLHRDQNHLVEVTTSFLPPSVKPVHATARSKRAVGLEAAAAGAARLVFGNPVKTLHVQRSLFLIFAQTTRT